MKTWRASLQHSATPSASRKPERGDKTPIVFLHGVGSDKSVWHPQLAHFGEERRALAFDYPGYGDSDPAPEGTTRDDYAAAILSAMSALGIDRAHVCGLSLGGVVAIAHARSGARPLRLADPRRHLRRASGRPGDLRPLALPQARTCARSPKARVDVLLAQPADPAVRTEVIETMARIDPAAFCIGAKAVWLADQRDRAGDIRAPTLVLCGAEDHVTPPALSRELTQLIPGARYEAIERAGHLANLERPQEFNTLVGAFIRGVDSRTGVS